MSPLLALFVPLALAAPTAEEEALRAALEGRGPAVLRALEAGDADQRWLAGRWAIQGAPGQVPRLLPGPSPREQWGLVDLLAAQGAWGEAATRALGLMDRALAGEHRDALAEQLVGWARERAAGDPKGAAVFLRAALALGPKERKAAEEAWFRLAGPDEADAVAAARRRLRDDPGCTPAALLDARALAPVAPYAAAATLTRLLGSAGRDDALTAARTLAPLPLPTPLVQAALDRLGSRFPRDLEVARLRLDRALALAERDTPAGLAALATLEGLGAGTPEPVAPTGGPKDPRGEAPDVGATLRAYAAEAARARAGATPDPAERRRLWLAIAAREGVGPRADEARAAALRALEESVAAAPAGEARRAAATAALREPDAAGSAALRFHALPEGPGRLAALRDFVGTWSGADEADAACGELADALLAGGTDRAGAEAFAEDCGGVNPAAEVLAAHATEGERLHLRPRPGGLDLLAATAARLEVQQHRVDPEALFLGTAGHPLDARLDAFLLEPDQSWTVERPEGSLRTLELRPRGGGPLVALTVRAGDERATALVPAHPLDVQVVRDADDLVIAVLDAGAPVSGANLLVQPWTGDPRRLRTGPDGLARIDDLADGVRIMARRGDALGWALTGPGAEPAEDPGVWSLVPWDPAAEAGGPVELSVFHASGSTTPPMLEVVSRTPSLRELERVPVRLEDGVGRVRVYAAPGGSLELVGGGAMLARASLRRTEAPRPLDPSVRVWFEPAAPEAGTSFVARVVPVGPTPAGGLAVELRVDDEPAEAFVLGPSGLSVNLQGGAEEAVSVSVRLPDGQERSRAVRVAPAPGWTAGLPAGLAPLLAAIPRYATVGAQVKMPGSAATWWRAEGDGQERWMRGGEAFVVPGPGTWTICAWDGRCAGEAELFVPDALTPLDAAGRWTGPTTLLAHTADGVVGARLIRAGEVLVPNPVAGAGRSPTGDPAPGARPGPGGALTTAAPPHGWLVSADPEASPLRVQPPVTPTPHVKAGLVRDGEGVVRFEGLPEGSRVWAWLWDATSGELPPELAVSLLWGGAPGSTQLPWEAAGVDGEAIAAALLAEEERLAEAREPERLDYGFGADEEIMGGASGYGTGGGGYGARGEGGLGSGGGAFGRVSRVAAFWADDPHALAVLEGGSTAPWTVKLPGWVTNASLRMLARTPEGTWVSLVEELDVGGAEPIARVPVAPAPLPAAPDGAALLAAARRLEPDSRAHAAAALAAAGVPGARAELADALAQNRAGPGAALAQALAGLTPSAGPERPALPDARRVERAETALATLLEDPERARAAAQRLLAEPGLEPWARARALLALWATGGDVTNTPGAAPSAADLAADDPGARSLAAAWAIVSAGPFVAGTGGTGPLAAPRPARPASPEQLAGWWAQATAEGALDADRALAIHALSLSLPAETAAGRRAPSPALPPAPAAERAGAGGLTLRVEAPYAEWRGQRFLRQSWIGVGYAVGPHPALDLRPGADGAYTLPRGAALPLWISVPPSPLPSRVACPAGPGLVSETAWVELRPSAQGTAVECRVRVWAAEALTVTWYRPDGRVAGRIVAPVHLGAPRDAALGDPLSHQELFALAVAQATSLAEDLPGGPPPEGDALTERRRAAASALEALLLRTPAPEAELRLASTTLLATWRDVGRPAELLAALRAYRERVPGGSLDLATAAAVAHAYAEVGEPERALAAARVVLDARFREELGAVNSLQGDGLALTSLKLLRALLERYPEGPTVVTARYLAPTMLLARAEGEGDRLGYTRSSLRHTAAAELAGFLLVHPDAPEAPKAAVLLADALHALGDPARERALTGLLARRYRAAPEAWRLALAEGRAALAEGRAAEALRLFDGMSPPPEARALVALERGRALDTLGRPEEARVAWAQSGLPEARDRAAWLDRAELTLPELVVLGPDDPPRLPATLAPGAEVSVTAIRVLLEAALLRDLGAIDPGALSVAGLAPTASRTVRVGADGDVPLPTLPTGAYVLTVTVGGLPHHTVLVRSDAELEVRGASGGSLVVLSDRAGRPIPGAQLWLFDGGEVSTATTDAAGTAWVASGGGRVGTLARAGDRYALANLGAAAPPPPSRAPAPAPEWREKLDENQRAYEQLFDQAAEQEVNAKAL